MRAIFRNIFFVLCLVFSVGKAQDSLLVLQSITIQGANKTKEKTVLREMSIQAGDSIPSSELDSVMTRNRNNVYNLSLFNSVDFNYITESGKIYLIILIRERWYIEPIVHANLEERYIGEWFRNLDLDRAVLGAGINWKNLTGYNDQLYLYLQEGYDREISASFRRPFLFPNQQIDFQINYSYTEKKEIELRTNYAARPLIPEDGQLLFRLPGDRIRFDQNAWLHLTKRFDPLNRLSLSVGYLHYQVNDTVNRINPVYLSNDGDREYYPKIRLSFNRDYRDWKSFPLTGHRLSVNLEQSGLGFLSTTNFLRLYGSYSRFYPIRKRWNYAWSFWGTYTAGKKIPYFDKVFIGTGNYLRGFEPFVISGTSVAVIQQEMRFALIPRQIVRFPYWKAKNQDKDLLRKFRDFPIAVYWVFFVDAGMMRDDSHNNMDPYFKNKPLIGFGTGLNFLTLYDHFLRIELSRNTLYNARAGYYFNLTGRIAIR